MPNLEICVNHDSKALAIFHTPEGFKKAHGGCQNSTTTKRAFFASIHKFRSLIVSLTQRQRGRTT
jgi:hypothetical protein